MHDGERRITDLAAELGGSPTSISSHVTSLKESGLITGRPQGRSVCYRIARPELDSVLEAAETLLAAAGQRVRLKSPRQSTRRNDAGMSTRDTGQQFPVMDEPASARSAQMSLAHVREKSSYGRPLGRQEL